MVESPSVKHLSAPELKAMIDSGQPFELIDVRTDYEREIASISGARLLDKASHDALLTLPKETTFVFQCHHGIRSQAAAEYFLQLGFTDIFNLDGGIDAWSLMVDPAVPRY
jgi:monothiol glutaredoxin